VSPWVIGSPALSYCFGPLRNKILRASTHSFLSREHTHAGADVFIDIVSGILHRYVRCAADLVSSSAEFASIKGITIIMSSIADSVMRHFEEHHFKAIHDRWLSTINLYTTYFPHDISVRTAMFTMHAPLADMILDAAPHAAVGRSKDARNLQMTAALRKIEMRSGTRVSGARAASVTADVMVDEVITELSKCSRRMLEDTINRKVGELLPSLEGELPSTTTELSIMCK
jgi:hypothetical protein